MGLALITFSVMVGDEGMISKFLGISSLFMVMVFGRVLEVKASILYDL